MESGGQSLKVNLIVYDNNVLQVTKLINCSIVTEEIFSGPRIKLLPVGLGELQRDGEAGGDHHE